MVKVRVKVTVGVRVQKYGVGSIWCKNIPEKLNPLSRVHARHRRQTTDGQTDGFAMPLAKRNVVTFG